jgi:hypothetical protein
MEESCWFSNHDVLWLISQTTRAKRGFSISLVAVNGDGDGQFCLVSFVW